MNKFITFASVLLVAVFTAAPASAGVVALVIGAIQGFAATSALAAFVVRIGISLVLTALSTALQKKPGAPRKPGIKTESTTTGGTNPQTFVLGRYASAGNMVAPPYSHPNTGGVPNKFLTYVVDLSDMPGLAFSRIMVAGEYVTDLQASATTHAQEGMLEAGAPHLFLTWHDGAQTVADAYMVENYGSHPDRPWSEDMVGTGVSYAVLTFLYNREMFNSLPGVLFEVDGVPLYDPRLDSTVGGSGSHRWDDLATWGGTNNPAVMVYNILRGITLPDGKRWGGQVLADDLPLDSWFAAMNECDLPVALVAGGTEPQYAAGLEISVNEEPASVIEELLKSCSGEISEFGGTYKVRVGPPALPVYFFTDDDVVADMPQSLAPYPGLDGVHNAIHASHPAPENLWQPSDAPPRYNAEWEAEDGGRQLVASVDLSPVASGTQVQRLMQAWIEDERRFRRHGLTLPPDAAVLEPLDTAAWTSAKEGYTAKVFEIGELTDDLETCLQTIAVRERDANDFNWTPAADEIALEYPSTVVTHPAARVLPGFDLLNYDMVDAATDARRPGLRLVWAVDGLVATDLIEYQVQLLDGTDVATGVVSDPLGGAKILAAGVLGLTTYRARAILVSRQGATWSDWESVTTSDVRLGTWDLDDVVQGKFTDLSQMRVDHDDLVAGFEGTLPDLEAAAQIVRPGVAVNPAFFDWSDTAPEGFVFSTSAGTAVKNTDNAKYKNCVELQTAAVPVSSQPRLVLIAGAAGGNNDFPAHEAERILVKAEVELVAGDWSGARIKATWNGTSVVSEYAGLDGGLLPERTGAVFPVSVVMERPASYVQDTATDELEVTLQATSSGGNGYSEKTVRVHSFDYEVIDASAESSLYLASTALADFQASAFVARVSAGGASAGFEMVAANDVGNGAASSILFDADSVLIPGTTRARHLVLDENLDIDEATGAFRMGKLSPSDFDNDGAFFGRTDEGGGITGFGFHVGRVSGGAEEYIRHTSADGLRLKNARFLIGAGVGDVYAKTVTENVELDPASVVLNLEIQGGGGGGNHPLYAAYPGGATVVVLKDGTTTIETWTASGGIEGPTSGLSAPGVAPMSPYGDGGDRQFNQTGLGDKGQIYGTWGKAGAAGALVVVDSYDISALIDPKLEITIGAAGTATPSAGNGAAGKVIFSEYANADVEAAPVAIAPSATGSFAVTSGVAGTFPVLAPTRGLWVVSATPAAFRVDPGNGVDIRRYASNLTFIASATPTWNANHTQAKTVFYHFYPM